MNCICRMVKGLLLLSGILVQVGDLVVIFFGPLILTIMMNNPLWLYGYIVVVLIAAYDLGGDCD